MTEIVDRTAQQFREGTRVVVDPDVDVSLTDHQAQAEAVDAWVAVLPVPDTLAGRSLVLALVEANDNAPGTYAALTVDPQGQLTADGGYLSDLIPDAELDDYARNAFADADGDVDAFITEFLTLLEERPSRGGTGGGNTGGSSSNGDGGGSSLLPLAILAGAGGLGFVIYRRRKRAREEAEEAAALAKLRTFLDEDITAYGEELDRLEIDLLDPNVPAETREDFGRALELYEQAKDATAKAKHPGDVTPVTHMLEEGRWLLAVVSARAEGKPIPERRPPCFFDPRHGPSVEDIEWQPPGGVARPVPACAADAQRIRDGLDPMSRTVTVAGRERPYWESPTYGPYAGGYYGADLFSGLFIGTLLGSMWSGGGGFYGGGYGGGDAGGGGDSGGDWGGGDFGGGGGWGGGDFGGGDFGGGDFGGF